ncbi:MAG TPA: type 1 glutamine amidotransferase domain-containing protein [Candidatus Baltobacteraceae bacterium]
MADKHLDGLRVAILLTDGFEQVEMTEPRAALDAAGATTTLVSPKSDTVQGMHHDQKGDTFPVDLTLDNASGRDFDALLLPGGVANPDALRLEPKAIGFVASFADKPIAAICHGPWTLIDAGLAKGKRMTSWPSLKTDLRNAGADWVDEKAVTDGNLVTSRKPDDIPAFNEAMIGLFAKRARA